MNIFCNIQGKFNFKTQINISIPPKHCVSFEDNKPAQVFT